MTKAENKKNKDLRDRAEEILSKSTDDIKKISPEEIKNILHELNVHKIELEMQNEELKTAQIELCVMRDKFAELFDFAPVGYIVLNQKNIIIEANLTICEMLGVERASLIKKGFSNFISPLSQDIFYMHKKQLIESRSKQTCELKLNKKGGEEFYSVLECYPKMDPEGNIESILAAIIDISTQKNAETKIKESEEKYRALFTNEKNGIFIYDPDTMLIMDSNPAMTNIYGYDKEELVGMSCIDLSAEQEKSVKAASVINKTGSIKVDMRWHKRKNGTVFPLELEGYSVTLQGKPIAFAVVKDITEKMESEKEQMHTYRILDSIIENIPSMLFLKDAKELRFVMFNRAGVELLGYSKEELIGKNDYDFFSKDQADCFINKDRKVLEEKREIDIPEEIINTRNIGERILHTKKVPILNDSGEVEFLLGLSEDITDRKIAERALQEEKHFVEGIVNTAQAIILVLDSEGRIVRYNPYMESLSGYSLQEVKGRSWFEIFLLKEDKKQIRELFKKSLSGIQIKGNINVIVSKDGKRRDIEWYDKTLTDNAGNVIGVLSIGMDVTSRLIAEKEKELLRDQLVQSQKMEAMGVLAGGVAHDFNNILTSIMGETELLLEEESIEDRLKVDIAGIKESSNRAADLVKQLLLFSRKSMMTLKPLDLNNTIIDLIKMLKRIIGEQISVNLDIPKDKFFINADSSNISQILTNICINSRDSMPDGGKLNISTKKCKLQQKEAEALNIKYGEYVKLIIEDTGLGMTKDIKANIFEPFFTSKGIGKGTGLGLSVVLGIVQAHNAGIEVYSELGIGTKLSIYFPIIQSIAGGKRQIAGSFKGKGEKIFVIEDEANIRNIVHKIFVKHNYKGVFAGTSAEAADIYRKESDSIDLVICDMVLPDGIGIELVKELNKLNPVKKLIYFSGYLDDQSKFAEIKKKNIPFIYKPFNIKDLLKVISETLKSTD